MRPLEGLLVIDFSQFLSGPSASLRLADLGARVIKIERPGAGDLCRQLYISNLPLDSDSTLFHSINRNKQSFAADLKNPEGVKQLRALLGHADVMIQNFRPGVIDRAGLGYGAVRALQPHLIYAEVTGYGTRRPWVRKPGQDLLVQSLSGLAYLNRRCDPAACTLRSRSRRHSGRRAFSAGHSCDAALRAKARTWRFLC